jgi:hypothetical protein
MRAARLLVTAFHPNQAGLPESGKGMRFFNLLIISKDAKVVERNGRPWLP